MYDTVKDKISPRIFTIFTQNLTNPVYNKYKIKTNSLPTFSYNILVTMKIKMFFPITHI